MTISTSSSRLRISFFIFSSLNQRDSRHLFQPAERHVEVLQLLVIVQFVLDNRDEVRKNRKEVHCSRLVGSERGFQRQGGLRNNGLAVNFQQAGRSVRHQL